MHLTSQKIAFVLWLLQLEWIKTCTISLRASIKCISANDRLSVIEIWINWHSVHVQKYNNGYDHLLFTAKKHLKRISKSRNNCLSVTMQLFLLSNIVVTHLPTVGAKTRIYLFLNMFWNALPSHYPSSTACKGLLVDFLHKNQPRRAACDDNIDNLSPYKNMRVELTISFIIKTKQSHYRSLQNGHHWLFYLTSRARCATFK